MGGKESSSEGQILVVWVGSSLGTRLNKLLLLAHYLAAWSLAILLAKKPSCVYFGRGLLFNITSTVLVEDGSRERQGLVHLACNQKGSFMSCKTWSGFYSQPGVPFRWKIITLVLTHEKRVRNMWPVEERHLVSVAELLRTPVQACPPPCWVGRVAEGEGKDAATSVIGTRN